jgi:hypothetical protein
MSTLQTTHRNSPLLRLLRPVSPVSLSFGPRSPRASTFSYHWNKCYALHREWGYAAVIVSNNDVVLPRNALSEFNDLLRGATPPQVKWLSLMTTTAGVAGGSLKQQISAVYPGRLPGRFMDYYVPIEETQNVQDAITAFAIALPRAVPRVITSLHDGKDATTGFFFGLRNLTLADGVSPRTELLPDSYLNVGQESWLVGHYKAYIATRAYVFHTKAATLPRESYRDDLQVCHEGQHPVKDAQLILARRRR